MRKRRFLLLLISFVLLACTCSLPNLVLPPGPPTERVAVTEPPAATEPPIPTEPPAPTAAPLLTPTVVRLHPSGGSLTAQISAEVPKAAALGQKMFVEFDASW
ncbi:MAG: hypothetical protein FD146_2624 [Anaerolineaceae bacterium]|nr:MAG: hypothetical protein FD146_2624 [Anaerolineaceae bacterium]